MKKGVVYVIGTYIVWGVLPIYWKLLQDVPATILVAYRVVWSLILVVGLLTYLRQWRWLKGAITNKYIFFTFLTTGYLLTVNWLVYIWAVNSGYIVDASLGYFINPLVSVLLGVIFFRERLRPGQSVAIVIAFVGVLYLTISYGSLPWIALTLACTFSIYGLLKKSTSLQVLQGLSLEMAVIFLPALGYLFIADGAGAGQFNTLTMLLLVGTGVLTAVPFYFYSAAAQKIPLSMMGILQYIAPTLQFLIGVLVYGETFTQDRMIGFSLVWLALIIYTIEGLMARRRRAADLRYAR